MSEPAVLSNFIGGHRTLASATERLDVCNPSRGFGDLQVSGQDAFKRSTDKKVTISRWF